MPRIINNHDAEYYPIVKYETNYDLQSIHILNLTKSKRQLSKNVFP